jgi:hypothetical protein
LIGPSLKRIKLWRFPKIEGSVLKDKVSPPLAQLSEIAKAYGIIVRCNFLLVAGNPISKIDYHYFWPRLIAFPKNTIYL